MMLYNVIETMKCDNEMILNLITHIENDDTEEPFFEYEDENDTDPWEFP